MQTHHAYTCTHAHTYVHTYWHRYTHSLEVGGMVLALPDNCIHTYIRVDNQNVYMIHDDTRHSRFAYPTYLHGGNTTCVAIFLPQIMLDKLLAQFHFCPSSCGRRAQTAAPAVRLRPFWCAQCGRRCSTAAWYVRILLGYREKCKQNALRYVLHSTRRPTSRTPPP